MHVKHTTIVSCCLHMSAHTGRVHDTLLQEHGSLQHVQMKGKSHQSRNIYISDTLLKSVKEECVCVCVGEANELGGPLLN